MCHATHHTRNALVFAYKTVTSIDESFSTMTTAFEQSLLLRTKIRGKISWAEWRKILLSCVMTPWMVLPNQEPPLDDEQ